MGSKCRFQSAANRLCEPINSIDAGEGMVRKWSEIGTANQLGHSNENTDVQLWLSPCRPTSLWTRTSIDIMISERQDVLLSNSICIPSRSQESTGIDLAWPLVLPARSYHGSGNLDLAYTEGSAIGLCIGLSMPASGLLGECHGLPILLSEFEWPVVKDLEPL